MVNCPAYKVDSFTCYVKLSFFTVVSPRLLENFVTYGEDSGEVLDEGKKPIFYDFDGISFRVSIFYLPHDQSEGFLRITFTSKMLRERYFEGINERNFRGIFDFAFSSVGCLINYEVFLLNCIVSDVDFCVDKVMQYTQFEHFIQSYNEVSGYKTFFKKAANYLEKREFSGMMLNNRRDSSIRHPFVKVYDKFEELTGNSSLFTGKFLLGQSFEGVKRLEVTIKNSRHYETIFKREKLDMRIISLGQNEIKTILSEIIGRYNGEKIIPKTPSTSIISPTKYVMGHLIMMAMENGHTLRELAEIEVNRPNSSYTSKSRLLAVMKESFSYVMEEKERDERLNLRITASDAFFV